MKKYFFFNMLICLAVLFTSCEKVPVNIPEPVDPLPADTSTRRDFKIVFEHLDNSLVGTDSLIAVLTIENTQTSVRDINISIPVVFNQQYRTGTLTLAKGNYKIKKLIIINSADLVKFATPVSGSVKASSVTKPLNIAFTLDDKTEKAIPAEVIPVNRTDTPESFGYPQVVSVIVTRKRKWISLSISGPLLKLVILYMIAFLFN